MSLRIWILLAFLLCWRSAGAVSGVYLDIRDGAQTLRLDTPGYYLGFWMDSQNLLDPWKSEDENPADWEMPPTALSFVKGLNTMYPTDYSLLVYRKSDGAYMELRLELPPGAGICTLEVRFKPGIFTGTLPAQPDSREGKRVRPRLRPVPHEPVDPEFYRKQVLGRFEWHVVIGPQNLDDPFPLMDAAIFPHAAVQDSLPGIPVEPDIGITCVRPMTPLDFYRKPCPGARTFYAFTLPCSWADTEIRLKDTEDRTMRILIHNPGRHDILLQDWVFREGTFEMQVPETDAQRFEIVLVQME